MGHGRLLQSGAACRCSGGFTLVELVIVIVLLGILAAVGSSMMADSFTTTRMADATAANQGQARYALERLAREIREIKYDDIGKAYCITSMTATNLVFTKTSGSYSNTCGTNDITVTVNNSGSNLTLAYSAAPAVSANLSSQVSGFSLAYYDGSGGANPSTGSVRYVVITLSVTDSVGGQSVSERTRVALRND